MKDLQAIINKRAEDRAKNEIKQFIEFLHKNNNIRELLDEIKVVVNVKDDKIITKSLKYVTDDMNDFIPNFLLPKLIELYTPEESEKFVKQVDRLTEEIEDLKNYRHE
jgi:hypothetical protein